jgi:hypothetical protein
LSIPEADIAMMREAGADAEERCQRELSALREAAERMTRRKAGAKYPAGSRVLIAKGPAQDLKGTVIGTARDGRLKTLVDGLNAIGTISVPSDHVRLVA